MSVAALRAAESLRALVSLVDVEVLSGHDCAVLAEEMALVEKACAALRAMAAARAADCGAHRRRGFSGAEDWAAAMSGATRRQAASELETGARLGECPRTRQAALEGHLSLGQAGEITRTERAKPGSEGELIDTAGRGSRQQLTDACRKRRQEGADRAELTRSQHARRSLRTWTDGDGMVCGQFRLEPVVGVGLVSRLQAEADRIGRQARRSGSAEGWEAHHADALVSMLGGGARTPRSRAEVVLVVDLRTFRTGPHPHTVSHIVGGGPVDPAVVAEMAKDAFLKVVFHDGVDIHTVTHLGRYIPAELRTALELGDPPEFDGVACSGCATKFRLQWDHLQPLCAGGVTSYDNEDPKCWDCHARKSDAERAAGLYGKGSARRPAQGGRAGGGGPSAELLRPTAWMPSLPAPPGWPDPKPWQPNQPRTDVTETMNVDL